MYRIALSTTAVAISFLSSFALALETGIEIMDRCSQDSLDPVAARGRIEWAFKCGDISRKKRDSWLLDDNDQPLARPQYPIFTTPATQAVWKAPTDPNAPCNRPPEYSFMIVCLSSCYTPEQRLAFIVDDEDNPLKKVMKWVKIETAFEKKIPTILAVSPDSTLDDIRYLPTQVRGYSHEFKEAWNDILEFRTEHSGKLRVTLNHPVLDGDGRIREASSFKLGEEFVRADGTKDPIVAINKQRHFGQVYNVDTKSSNLKSKLVLAEGFINGSLYYQNNGFGHMNRKLLREQISEELLP